MPSVTLTPEVEQFLNTNPVCAIGVSGGKDSAACALAVHRYLDSIGFTGQRLAVHADLGRVEWRQSLDKCRELADSLGWELMVVKRNAGDLMDRWLGRWDNNVTRYKELSCVQLILPWSTAAMRFCTSEMKASIIRSNLKKRFPGQNILNITGVRREESASRAKMPVFKVDPQLVNKGGQGMSWNAIIDWSIDEVFEACASHSVALHEAYTRYGMSRVSCTFCILSSGPDLQASSTCPDNHDIYREMVDLEISSAFSFQSNRWLGDVNPDLLSEGQHQGLARAKVVARERAALEASIPKELLYEKGLPVRLPSLDEASRLADIRIGVSALQGFVALYQTGAEIRERYAELLARRDLQVNDAQLIPAFQVPGGSMSQIGFVF
jgi:3'-phosphoadenosine 5'-phosphosulfate sulfotransferase (PAPS reductase)/FAD synthetase